MSFTFDARGFIRTREKVTFAEDLCSGTELGEEIWQFSYEMPVVVITESGVEARTLNAVGVVEPSITGYTIVYRDNDVLYLGEPHNDWPTDSDDRPVRLDWENSYPAI